MASTLATAPTSSEATVALRVFLREQARGMNSGEGQGENVVSVLAGFDLLKCGVPEHLGGDGRPRIEAFRTIATIAAECMTSAFVYWAQRVFIEYVVRSANARLQRALLPPLLNGELHGASGLSNAMKHLSGIETLRLTARAEADELVLNGQVPWVSNVRPERFAVAVAARSAPGLIVVAAVPSGQEGMARSGDFRLHGLQSSYTAGLTLTNVRLSEAWIISDDGQRFLPQVRPFFLGLQCGMAVGLAGRAIAEARSAMSGAKHVLGVEVDRAETQLDQLAAVIPRLMEMEPAGGITVALFQARICTAELAMKAALLELQVQGGAGYLKDSACARRLREAAFLPVLTPSSVHLRTELARRGCPPAS